VLGLEQCEGTHMKIETTPVGEVSFEGMGNKYCFSMKAIKSWQVCHYQRSISPTFYEHFLLAKNRKAQKDTNDLTIFLHF
jgi:hypothetical protein